MCRNDVAISYKENQKNSIVNTKKNSFQIFVKVLFPVTNSLKLGIFLTMDEDSYHMWQLSSNELFWVDCMTMILLCLDD